MDHSLTAPPHGQADEEAPRLRHQMLKERLTPPAETTASLVLNGIGNGMMVGVAPFLLMEMYSHVAGVALSRGIYMANAAATVAGCVFGASYGYAEARKLQSYRTTVGDELLALNERMDALKGASGWVEKVTTDPSSKHAEPSR